VRGVSFSGTRRGGLRKGKKDLRQHSSRGADAQGLWVANVIDGGKRGLRGEKKGVEGTWGSWGERNRKSAKGLCNKGTFLN